MLRQVETNTRKIQRRTDKDKTSQYEKIEHRNYEPIIGKSKSDEYNDEI